MVTKYHEFQSRRLPFWFFLNRNILIVFYYLPHDVFFIRIVTFCSYNTLNFLPNNAGMPGAFKIWSAQVSDLVQNATALTFFCYKVDWIVLFFRSILISGTVEILVFCFSICLGFSKCECFDHPIFSSFGFWSL